MLIFVNYHSFSCLLDVTPENQLTLTLTISRVY